MTTSVDFKLDRYELSDLSSLLRDDIRHFNFYTILRPELPPFSTANRLYCSFGNLKSHILQVIFQNWNIFSALSKS